MYLTFDRPVLASMTPAGKESNLARNEKLFL